jgi:hypothetical protein
MLSCVVFCQLLTPITTFKPTPDAAAIKIKIKIKGWAQHQHPQESHAQRAAIVQVHAMQSCKQVAKWFVASQAYASLED